MKKKLIAFLTASTMLFTMSISAYAAQYEFTHKNGTKTTPGEVIAQGKAGEILAQKQDYKIELKDGKQYNLADYLVALKDNPTFTEDQIIEKLNENAAEELKVVSVSAINAKEIKVVFGAKVAKSVAETAVNYTLTKGNADAASPTVANAELQEDEKTVILTLNDGAAINSKEGAKYLVVISKIVTPENKKFEEYSQLLTLFDNAVPEVTELTYPDSNTVKISFSEPLNTISTGVASATKITLDGANVVVPSGAYKLAADKKSFTISVSDSGLLRGKTYQVMVSGIVDFADNKIKNYEGTLKIEKDEEKPTVTEVKSLSLSSVQVIFSEKVDASVINNTFKFKLDGTAATGVTITNPSKDGKAFVAKFTAPAVTPGNKVITIYDYKDFSSNEGKSYTKEIAFAAGNPAFMSTVGSLRNILGNNYIVFQLDREIALVNSSDTYTATYVEDGVEKTNTAIQFEAKAQRAELAKNEIGIPASLLTSSGQYTLSLEKDKIQDSFGQKNKAAELTFKYDANIVNATVSTVAQQTAPNLDIIKVVFSREMGAEVLDVSKYTVDGVQVFESAKFVGNKKTVHLELKAGAIAKTEEKVVKIAGIAGLDDKVYDGTGSNPSKITLKENVKPEITKAELIALDKVRVTFSEKVIAAVTDFEVKINGVKTSAPLDLSGSTTNVIMLKLASADKLKSSATPVTVEIVEGATLKDETGNEAEPVTKNAVVNLEDTEQEAIVAIENALKQFDFANANDGALEGSNTAATARAAYDAAVAALNNHAAIIDAGKIKYNATATSGNSEEIMAVLEAAVLVAEAEDFARTSDLTIEENYKKLFDGALSMISLAESAKEAANNQKILSSDQAKTDLAARITALKTTEKGKLDTALNAYPAAKNSIDAAAETNTAAKLATAATDAKTAVDANENLTALSQATKEKLTADTKTLMSKLNDKLNLKFAKGSSNEQIKATWGSDDGALAISVTSIAFDPVVFDQGKGVTAMAVSAAGAVTATTNATDAVNFTVSGSHAVFKEAPKASVSGTVASGGTVVTLN